MEHLFSKGEASRRDVGTRATCAEDTAEIQVTAPRTYQLGCMTNLRPTYARISSPDPLIPYVAFTPAFILWTPYHHIVVTSAELRTSRRL